MKMLNLKHICSPSGESIGVIATVEGDEGASYLVRMYRWKFKANNHPGENKLAWSCDCGDFYFRKFNELPGSKESRCKHMDFVIANKDNFTDIVIYDLI